MLTKIKRLIGELGAINAFLYMVHVLLSKPTGHWARIERFLLVSQPVPPSPRLPAGRSKGVEVRRLVSGDELLAQVPRPPEVISSRYAQGAICLALVKTGKVQGYIWLIEGGYEEDVARVLFVLPASGKAAWDFDVYVAPEYRLGFTFARLWDAADAYLRDRGVHWSMSRISMFNAESLNSHGRLGAKAIGSATFLIVGPFQLMVSGLPPYIHLSWGCSRPSLRMPEP